ncbi:hypothetical protein [Roseibium aggregatum]|uniref:Uncharacterized protein n=1 Tax=Roseibium aggregatum TaxID=187304 RepID=A0A939EG62_9HYPH|nr:hypothetical protein [Roseibium aggregatum]MBN9672126.1 hypothetical protein [Roseibium aggregatum]
MKPDVGDGIAAGARLNRALMPWLFISDLFTPEQTSRPVSLTASNAALGYGVPSTLKHLPGSHQCFCNRTTAFPPAVVAIAITGSGTGSAPFNPGGWRVIHLLTFC